MSGVSNLGKALTVVFVFALLALLLELLYVLWRRRFLFPRRRDPPQTTVDQPEVSTPSPNSVSFLSKNDLLYLLCYRNQSRVEPDGSDPTRLAEGSLPVDNGDDDEMEIIDLYKLSEMYGPPSRFLFTIKEGEEKEELESDKSTAKSRNLSQSFGDTGDSTVFVVAVEEEEDSNNETPFSTPCASPSYFTPSGSPVHQINMGRGTCPNNSASESK